MNNKVKILDCTFRDGGYYNQWDFDYGLVQRYILSVENSGIDIIELGFRNFPQEVFFGAFAYTTDNYIDSLKIDSAIVVGVMVDATSFLKKKMPIKDLVSSLFQNKSKSRVDLVRIATHFDAVSECKEIAQELMELGYKVGLNLMQSNSRTTDELSTIAKVVQSWNSVTVLYFADSLGGMSNNDVVKVVSALKAEWTGELGFHSHNNKGLAVSNSLTAIDNGVTWIDSTILGMGRGAGNAQTEYLLLELSDKYQMDYYPEALFELVLSDFTMLHNKYRWGASLLYSLAAMNSIHPTYIQKMLSDDCYSNREVLQAIDFMSTVDSSHYKEDLLLTPCNTTESTGTWDAEDWCLKKKVLILGSGEGAVKYQDAIIQYIDIHNPIVISLNIFKSFPAKLIDIYASSNEAKILRDYSFYNKLNKPIVAPRVLIDKIISRHRDIPNLLDYGLNIKKDTFGINKNNCILPYELSIGYVLSFVNAGGAKEIFVVGFDGYSSNDIRQIKINELFELYHEQNLISVVSLTPTTYNIKQDSIYNIN